METAFDHTVLIVDDEEQVARAIASLLKRMGVKFVYAKDGESALEKVRDASPPFSLILSDQRMEGMLGHEFLEKAKTIAPDTVRFLITGFADIQTVIDAVNRGAIQHYISKPWDNTEFMSAIEKGLRDYELVLEGDRLMSLAKEQNKKLYKLNKDLKDRAEEQRKRLETLDREIEGLKDRVNLARRGEGRLQGSGKEGVLALCREQGLLTEDAVNAFFAAALHDLYSQFEDIATKHGFNMPENV